MKKFLLGTVFGVATAATAFAVKEIVEKKVAEEVEAELARINNDEDECDEDCSGCMAGCGLFDVNADEDTSEEADDEDESSIRKFFKDVLGVSVETHKCNSFAEFMECVARDMKENGMSDAEIEDAVNKAKAVKSAAEDAEAAADKADDKAEMKVESNTEVETEGVKSDDKTTEEETDDVDDTFESDIPDPTPEDVDA